MSHHTLTNGTNVAQASCLRGAMTQAGMPALQVERHET